MAYVACFATLFLLMRWWRQADPLRQDAVQPVDGVGERCGGGHCGPRAAIPPALAADGGRRDFRVGAVGQPAAAPGKAATEKMGSTMRVCANRTGRRCTLGWRMLLLLLMGV